MCGKDIEKRPIRILTSKYFIVDLIAFGRSNADEQ